MESKYGNWKVVGESDDDGTYLVNPVFPNNTKQGYEVECDRTLELGKTYEGRIDAITSHATLIVEGEGVKVKDKASKYQKLANEYELLARDVKATADKYKCLDSMERSQDYLATSQKYSEKAKLEASRESLEDLV